MIKGRNQKSENTLINNSPLCLMPYALGFTLLEIMIALAIIGITVTVVLHTVNYHAEIMYQNTVTTHMYQMAKEKMHELEEIRSNAKGDLGTAYTFENRVSRSNDTDIVELKTIVRGDEKEVSLIQLVIDKSEGEKE